MIPSGLVGPKPRPRGVGDGHQVDSPGPRLHRSSERGDVSGRQGPSCGHGGCVVVACHACKRVTRREGEANGSGRSVRGPQSPRKAPTRGADAPVPQTDAGGLEDDFQGERVILCQGTRQIDPVTSGEGGPR